ncbi:uncharacterized protein EI90DRAFT_290363 [Cantharellus anzutake]|uniref:uncharacterized protein n=1 Tax=Cantharellus anzutake TaxID=1750568 RepID=UPI001906C6C7|nr:uncharacterized protein EI90DRAFT_290363 [Cantharellus anzutake]KAF8316210.1 hypothetical protein EI90DRAFT_290363 [Cantharellus anzutake]
MASSQTEVCVRKMQGVVVSPDPHATIESIQGAVGTRATPQSIQPQKITFTATDPRKSDCHRLFPSRIRLGAHRRRDHGTEDTDSKVVTWDDSPTPLPHPTDMG